MTTISCGRLQPTKQIGGVTVLLERHQGNRTYRSYCAGISGKRIRSSSSLPSFLAYARAVLGGRVSCLSRLRISRRRGQFRLLSTRLLTVFVREGGYAVWEIGANVVNVLGGFESP